MRRSWHAHQPADFCQGLPVGQGALLPRLVALPQQAGLVTPATLHMPAVLLRSAWGAHAVQHGAMSVRMGAGLSRQLKLRFVCQPLKKVALMAPCSRLKFHAAWS